MKKEELIEKALCDAGEIQTGLRALLSALYGVRDAMGEGNLKNQVAVHCETLEAMDKRMEGLNQTIAFAKHDANVRKGE